MKFSISSSELLKQLQKLSGAISSNPVLPILEDFLFSIEGNQLSITSTNLETSIETVTEVSSDEDGKLAIPAKILLETLKALPDQPISFTVDQETRGIEITSAYGKYKLAGDAAEDYPEIPTEDNVSAVEIDSGILANALSKTIFATSNDELRLAMTGVLVQVDFDKLVFVATDAHKLVKYEFSGIQSSEASSFIIPKKSLMLLKNTLPSDGQVKIKFNKSNAFFEFGATRLVCRLIDAKYPDYNAVIPTDNPNELQISRLDFQNSLKRIAIYSNKTTNQVVLNLDNGSLTISAQDLDFSNEATEQQACDYTGDAMSIGFNAKFLIEMLGVLETDNVRLKLSSPSRAGILVPDEIAEGEDLLMLVMPVMMNN